MKEATPMTDNPKTPQETHEHEWERGVHMADAFGVDGRVAACAICGMTRRDVSALHRPSHALLRGAVGRMRSSVHELLNGLWACEHGYGPGKDGALCEDVAICIIEGGGFAERLWDEWSAWRQAESELQPRPLAPSEAKALLEAIHDRDEHDTAALRAAATPPVVRITFADSMRTTGWRTLTEARDGVMQSLAAMAVGFELAADDRMTIVSLLYQNIEGNEQMVGETIAIPAEAILEREVLADAGHRRPTRRREP